MQSIHELISNATPSRKDKISVLKQVSTILLQNKANPAVSHEVFATIPLIDLLRRETSVDITILILNIIFHLLYRNNINFKSFIEKDIALPLLYDLSHKSPHAGIRESVNSILKYYWLHVKPRNPRILSSRSTDTITTKIPFHLGVPVNTIGAIELATVESGPMGQGSFGTVLKSMYQNQAVAVKKYNDLCKIQAHQSFFEEAYLHGQLKHPHIVTMMGICIEPGHYALVLELMINGSLWDIFCHKKPLTLRDKIQIGSDIMAGLAYLHDQKVIHADLKSPNILLDHAMRAKISDFGSSLVIPETGILLDIYIGTNRWRAPELFSGTTPPTVVSDIYASGIILWELMSQKPPYHKLTTEEKIKDFVCSGNREKIRHGTPVKYAALIQRCWDQSPQNRPQSAHIAHVELNECLETIDRKTAKKRKGEDSMSNSKRHCFFSQDPSLCFSTETIDTFPIDNLIDGPCTVSLNG